MIALTAPTSPRSSTAATGTSATGSPRVRMRSSSASVHREFPSAPTISAASQTLRGGDMRSPLRAFADALTRKTRSSARLTGLPDHQGRALGHHRDVAALVGTQNRDLVGHLLQPGLQRLDLIGQLDDA